MFGEFKAKVYEFIYTLSVVCAVELGTAPVTSNVLVMMCVFYILSEFRV
jgi:hypothetical protein